MVRLRWKIEDRTSRQTGHEIEHGKMQTSSTLAAPDTGQGRAEGGARREEVGPGGWLEAADRWIRRAFPVAGNITRNRFRGPERFRLRAGRAGLR